MLRHTLYMFVLYYGSKNKYIVMQPALFLGETIKSTGKLIWASSKAAG